jgi:hypothetical protein
MIIYYQKYNPFIYKILFHLNIQQIEKKFLIKFVYKFELFIIDNKNNYQSYHS